MIRFDFTLEDHEAENLFDCISGEINKLNMEIMDLNPGAESNAPTIAALRGQIGYLNDLMTKMNNRRVAEKPSDVLEEIVRLREEAIKMESDFLTTNRKTIMELGEIVLLLRKKGRLQSYEREALDKMLSDASRTYFTKISVADAKNVVVDFRYLDHEAGWLSYFEYPINNITLTPDVIANSTTLRTLFEKRKAEWAIRDQQEQEQAIQQRREKLQAELEKLG